jgi:hypothetical protein
VITASTWHSVWKVYMMQADSNIMQQKKECRCTNKAPQIHGRNKLIELTDRKFISYSKIAFQKS